jgi:hypothetical protein
MVVAVVGHQDPAESTHAEPCAQAMDEREALARGSVVDQRSRGLAQNLVLHAQTMDLTPLPAQFGTQAADGAGQITVATSASGHK